MTSKTKGALLMVSSAGAFAVMQVLIAQTADTIPLFQQLFFRNLFAAIFAYILLKRQKLRLFGAPKNRSLLLWRSAMGYLGMVTLFYAAAHANQGDVAVINKTSPFIIVLCAYIVFKERIQRRQMVALIMAFLGAVLAANAQFSSSSIGLIAAGLSAIFSGIAYFSVSALRGREEPSVIVFFFSAFSTIVTLGFMVFNFVIPTWQELLLLVAIGVSALVGQLTLTYAYIASTASEVSIFNYTGIIFSMLLGYIFLAQPVTVVCAAGAVLVLLAGVVVLLGKEKP